MASFAPLFNQLKQNSSPVADKDLTLENYDLDDWEPTQTSKFVFSVWSRCKGTIISIFNVRVFTVFWNLNNINNRHVDNCCQSCSEVLWVDGSVHAETSWKVSETWPSYIRWEADEDLGKCHVKAEDLGIFRKAVLFDIVCRRLAVLLSWSPWCATMELSMGAAIEITEREERKGRGGG